MPPKSRLPADEVAILEEWVKRGAPSPEGPPVALAANAAGAADAKPKQVGLTIEEGKKFWSFVPPVKPAVPAAANNWPMTYRTSEKSKNVTVVEVPHCRC